MHKIAKMIAAALAAALLTVSVSAAGHGWYVTYNGNAQPKLPPEFTFIESKGGIYLDKAHGDDAAEKVIYLTFDAGYENGNIAKILDILEAHNAKATFFVLENLIKRDPDLVKRMFNDGHTVANHTMSHKNMAGQPRAVFEAELHGLEALCLELTGREMAKIYRPPEGSFAESDLDILSDMGYKTAFWSCAYADWDNAKQPSREAALDKLFGRLHNGEVLLLHPTSATNAAILDEFLTTLEGRGYTFGSLEALCAG